MSLHFEGFFVLSAQGNGWHSSLNGESLRKFHQEFFTSYSQQSGNLDDSLANNSHSGENAYGSLMESQPDQPIQGNFPEEEELLGVDLLGGCSQHRLQSSSPEQQCRWDAPGHASASGLPPSFLDGTSRALAGSPEDDGNAQGISPARALPNRSLQGAADPVRASSIVPQQSAALQGDRDTLALDSSAPVSAPALQGSGSSAPLEQSTPLGSSAAVAAASALSSEASGCLRELELLAASMTGAMVADGDLDAAEHGSNRGGASHRRSVSEQWILGEGTMVQGEALLREPEQGGMSPQHSGHRMDFADVGSPPMEEENLGDGGCFVFGLDRPAATPMLQLPAGAPPHELPSTAAGPAQPPPSDGGQGWSAHAEVSAAQEPAGQQPPDGLAPADQLAEHQGDGARPADAPAASGAEGGTLHGAAGVPKLVALKMPSGGDRAGDVGHLRIRAFRPPRSPSVEPPPQMQLPGLVPGGNAAELQPGATASHSCGPPARHEAGRVSAAAAEAPGAGALTVIPGLRFCSMQSASMSCVCATWQCTQDRRI